MEKELKKMEAPAFTLNSKGKAMKAIAFGGNLLAAYLCVRDLGRIARGECDGTYACLGGSDDYPGTAGEEDPSEE